MLLLLLLALPVLQSSVAVATTAAVCNGSCCEERAQQHRKSVPSSFCMMYECMLQCVVAQHALTFLAQARAYTLHTACEHTGYYFTGITSSARSTVLDDAAA
jgi:hypothetical protein